MFMLHPLRNCSLALKCLPFRICGPSFSDASFPLANNKDWTILRPGGLKSDHPTGKAILTEDKMASGSVDRADVADIVLKVLGTEGLYTRREFTVVDPTYHPEYNYRPFHA